MGKLFSVKKRAVCKVCGKPVRGRYRIFCSKNCRVKDINKRHYDYQINWLREKRGEYADNKIRCLICDRYYVQIGSHVVQVHKVTSREYKEYFELPVKRGVIPSWYRKVKGDAVFENGTVENLKTGKKYWYKKNDPRARETTFWKGKQGSKPFDYDALQ